MVDLKKLIPAVQFVESSDNPDAYNKKSGARGLMQVVDKTKDKPGFGVKGAIDDSPEERNRVGRDYLGAMVKRFGNKEDALIAYNWGPGNTRKWIAAGRDKSKLPDETRNYITKVNKQLNQRSRGIKMADTSGFLKMNPKERRIRVRQANRAIQTAKSVGMKPKASDLNILKMASKADKGPITKKEMRSDRRKAGTGALAAATVVPGIGLAAKGITSGVKAVKGARAASAAAKKLAEQKAKKAAAAKAKREAAKKAKQAQEKANAARKAREAQGRSSAGGAADDAVAQGVSAAAKKAARKKVTDAAKKKAAQQKKLESKRTASANRNKVNRPTVANKKYQTKADGSLKLRNGKPILKKPTTAKPTTAAKPKTPAKPKTDSKMVSTKPGRPLITKKRAKVIGGTALGAAGVGGLALLLSGKEKKPVGPNKNPTKNKSRAVKSTPRGSEAPVRRTKSKRADNSGMLFDPNLQQTTPDVGAKSQKASPKPAKKVSSGGRGKSKGSMGGETIGEYFEDLSQRKTKVKTPFGLIDVDTTPEGMAIEEFDQKYGGKVMTRKKGRKAKPRRRAALRGHRAEQRGG